ncbi:MAG: hypothetical protein N3A61_02590, partial [Ignavibacteria bacterium]|nr:hypothetical protein [Ignavibacteria bacterium]
MKNDIINFYLNELSLIDKFSTEQNHNYLDKIRKESKAKLSELKFPTIKNEEWKYTDVSPILSKTFKPTFLDKHSKQDYSELRKLIADDKENILMVFVNGNFANDLSNISETKDKLRIVNLSQLLKT